MTDALSREIELTAQRYCLWVVEPGWTEYVQDKVKRLAEARPELFADLKARVDAAFASSSPAIPSAKDAPESPREAASPPSTRPRKPPATKAS